VLIYIYISCEIFYDYREEKGAKEKNNHIRYYYLEGILYQLDKEDTKSYKEKKY